MQHESPCIGTKKEGQHKPRKRLRGLFKGLTHIFRFGVRVSQATLSNAAIEDLKQTTSHPPKLSLFLPRLDIKHRPSIDRRVSPNTSTREKRARNAALPIGSLPPEILTEVFAMACFSDVQATNSARRTRTTPLTLIKICSRWRAIVLSTPHLWSWVLIRLYKSSYHSQLGLIRDWLDRTAQSQPLTVELSFEDEDAWVDIPPNDLLEMLLKESHRWRSIDLTLPEACYQVIKTSKVTFPNLEDIALQPLLSDSHTAQAHRKSLDVFDGIPKLSNLRLNGYYLDDCLVPWSQLQDLVLQHVYIDECFYALDKASNLVSCTLSTMLPNDCNRQVTKHPLTLPKLESLRLQGASGMDQGLLISHLTAPSLSELALSSTDAALSFADIPEMVSRSGCALRKFELDRLDVVESKLIDLLRNLPTVETLRVNPNNSGLGNAFLEALCDNAPQPPLTVAAGAAAGAASGSGPATKATTPFLPNLQFLEYDGSVVTSFDEEVLVRMIKLRSELNVQDRTGAGGGFWRRLEVLKLGVYKAFGAECQGLLAGLSGS